MLVIHEEESTLCLYIVIIPKWDSNIKIEQRFYTILGDYHEFNLKIEFESAYIKLEITLIHFQIGHTQSSISIVLLDLHYIIHGDYPQRAYPILNFELEGLLYLDDHPHNYSN